MTGRVTLSSRSPHNTERIPMQQTILPQAHRATAPMRLFVARRKPSAPARLRQPSGMVRCNGPGAALRRR